MDATWWTNLSQLDAKQKEVIALGAAGNHLVIGPAGCGKTNLLLLRAAFLHRSGVKNIVVLTLGRVLKEFLTTGASHYPFSADKIQTTVQWASKLLQENGMSFEGEGSFDSVREKLFDALKDVADQELAENKLDCILLDEAQDYSGTEISILTRFADQVFAVGDDRQRIFDLKGGLDALKLICPSQVSLTHHYRNSRKICRVADGIRNMLDDVDGLEASSKYDESSFVSSVKVFGNKSLDDQVKIAVDEITEQLVAYPGEQIGVICPRQDDITNVFDLMATTEIADKVQLQNYKAGYSAFIPERPVILTTVHGAKGLEFRALHILGSEFFKKFRPQKNMTYTAITRCKTSLRIYHQGSLAGYLEKGLAALNSSDINVTNMEDLFLG